jgi:hypothetical protein
MSLCKRHASSQARRALTCCAQPSWVWPAGESPARGDARVPGSWLPASGESPASKRSDKPRLAGCKLVVRTMRNPVSVEKPGLVTGHRREPNLSRNGEGHGRRLWSWSRRSRTLRRTGSGTSTRSGPELGRSSSARGLDAGPRKRCSSITGDPGKWRAAERKSDGVVVAVTVGTTQPDQSEAPLLCLCLGRRYERVSAHRG